MAKKKSKAKKIDRNEKARMEAKAKARSRKLDDFELDESRPYIKMGYAKTKEGEKTSRIVAQGVDGEDGTQIDKIEFAKMLTQLQANNTLAVLNEIAAVRRIEEEVQKKADELKKKKAEEEKKKDGKSETSKEEE